MPIEPIKIPQNVYIEDRIVGPLTLKQLLITAMGCGLSYAIYSVLLKATGSLPLPVTIIVWIPGALSILFAFVRINDLSMLHILLLTVERMNKPATRTWSPRRGITINLRTSTTPDKKPDTPAEEPVVHSRHIEELSSILDQPYGKTSADRPPETEVSPDAQLPPRPVDPARIAVTPLRSAGDMDIAPAPEPPSTPPETGTVSIFRDISPPTV